jgi:hypothetical protein
MTMADSADENPLEVELPNDPMVENDDITVVTTTTATKTDFIEQEMTESIIRYEIPYRQGHAADDDFKLHAQLLKVLTAVHDDSDLRIYDNKSQRIKDFAAEKWLDKPYHSSHFNYFDDTAHRKTVIAHRIRSKKPISTLKGDPQIISFLKKTNTYLRAHFWKEDELAIKDVGFLVSYIPSKHSKAFVTNDMLERTELLPNLDWAKVPQFQLIHATPRVKLSGRQKPLHTQAYSVQILAKDSNNMNQALRQIFSQDHLYVPYNMKRSAPQAVAKAIIKQNQLIADTYVIVLVGVSRDIMTALKPTLLQGIQSIIAVSDTNRTDKNGRWHVIVKEKGFTITRKYIATNLQLWIRTYPSTLHESTPDHFPPPQVSQKYADADDDSSGHASYMSSCAQSYGSVEDLDSESAFFYTPDNRSTAPSYADIVRQPAAPALPQNNLPAGTDIEFSATDRELRAIIATLQNEVQQLKNRVPAQTPSTPSTVTEATMPDSATTQLSSRMDTFEVNINKWMSDISFMLHRPHQPLNSTELVATRQHQPKRPPEAYSPPRHPKYASPASHHSKRQDNRGTPERGDPMITQPSIDSPPRHHPVDPDRYYRTTRGYDPKEPEALYLNNGDGSLYPVGMAGPKDYDQFGNRLGHHHPDSPPQYPSHYGPPSPKRQPQNPVTGSPPSLPAAGAQHYHQS